MELKILLIKPNNPMFSQRIRIQ